jgi:DNA-binding transcriptional regulator YbjK
MPLAVRERPAASSPDRRVAILDAALCVIAAGGVDAVTHREVAAQAAVPLGSTTYYFASRDELLREAFRHYAAGVLAWLEELWGESVRPPTAAAVVAFLVEVAQREFARPEFVLVEYELILRAARDPALAQVFRAYEHALAARLAEALERLGAAHPFDSARTLIALVRGFELERLTEPAADFEDLRGRLAPVVAALVPDGPRTRSARRPSRRSDKQKKEKR